MHTVRHTERREKLRRLMHEHDLSAMLVTLDANRFYLSGFELIDHQVNESAGCILITADGNDWLCTDARYLDAARRLWSEDRIFIYGGADAAKQINALVRDRVTGTVGIEEDSMSVGFWKSFSEGLTLANAEGLVAKLRVIKEPEEIEYMRASAALNHKLMEWLPAVLTPGKSEQTLAWEIEQFFRNNGAESLSFPTIAAVGTNAALPHAIPGSDSIKENTCVLVDAGCRLNGYCSDQTRTFWVGDKPTDIFMQTLSLVRTAQEKAIAAIKPGVAASAVYSIAREVFAAKGVETFFTHGLGHGVGLQTHEAPSLNSRSNTILLPGMIVTVEPGLYYPEWGGVRWEYMVLVTEDGSIIM